MTGPGNAAPVTVERLRALYEAHLAWPVGKHTRNGATSEENAPYYAANRAREELLEAFPVLLAALASAPVCSASPDHADIMETIANAGDDWQKQGYPTALAEVRDMANVGRSLLERIADHSSEGPLKGWHPADCPTEVVCDLLNMLADASAPAPSADSVATAKARLSIAAVRGRNTGQDRIGVDPSDIAVLVAAHSDLDRAASAPAGDGVEDRYSEGYSQGTIDANQQHQWMQDKAWQDAVLMLVHYNTLAERTWLIGHEEAARKLAEWWGHARALADTKTTDDIAALARPHSAAAPAGDGVPAAWMYEKKSSVSDLVRRIVNADRDNYAVGKGWTETALYPALARPRAAVGEREAVEAAQRLQSLAGGAALLQVYGPEWCMFPTVQMRADLATILAPQSPPAKVEGKCRCQRAAEKGIGMMCLVCSGPLPDVAPAKVDP